MSYILSSLVHTANMRQAVAYKGLKRMENEGREGVKWELGLALLWTGKMGFTHWEWDEQL